MNAKQSEVKKPLEKRKSGAQVVHIATVHHFPDSDSRPSEKAARMAKSDVAYWQKAVASRIVHGKPTLLLYVRFRKDGRDVSVCLNTRNKATAATAARDLWKRVEGIGLAAALAEFRPKSAPRAARAATIGALITATRELSTVRSSTLAQYEISLRRLVAGVLGMKATGSVFYHKSPEAIAWRAKVEGAHLDVLTDARVEGWRKGFIAAAPDEVAKISAKNTAAATIRNARGFFGKEIAKALAEQIHLPSPLPLVGLNIGASTRRFKSTTDLRGLYEEALAGLHGDSLTAFLLCLTGGLRRGEADLLPWSHVDLEAANVTVAPTKWFLPKTEESQRSTPIPPDVVAHLRACRAMDTDAEFVLTGLDPAKKRDAKKYRCPCWKALAVWLRLKGFKSQNPIHELRKLSGSHVNANYGLEAARRHLGHRNISTTAGSYVTGSAALVNLAAPAPRPTL